MDPEKDNAARDQAWSHFTFHVTQRFSLLKFAIGAAVVVGFGIALLAAGSANQWLILGLGIFLALIAAILGVLDQACERAVRSSGRVLDALDAAAVKTSGGTSAPVLEHSGLARSPLASVIGVIYLLIAAEGIYFAALPFYLPKPPPPPAPATPVPATPPQSRPYDRSQPYPPYQNGLNRQNFNPMSGPNRAGANPPPGIQYGPRPTPHPGAMPPGQFPTPPRPDPTTNRLPGAGASFPPPNPSGAMPPLPPSSSSSPTPSAPPVQPTAPPTATPASTPPK